MAFTFAVPDLHGRADLLDLALAAVTARGGGTVVFTGDYVDRGPTSRQIIERLMAGAPEGQRWLILKGNHEDMMVEVCRGRAPIELWVQNGGGSTLVSYGHPRRCEAVDLSVVPSEHVAWLDRLGLLFADEHRIYVHAGIDPTLPFTAQSKKTMLWMRDHGAFDDGFEGKHVVHGHTPLPDGPDRRPGRTNLDTLAWHTGRLCIGVFDDDVPGGPVEVIEIRGELIDALTGRAT
ncbi:metallophosphoesterase [Methylobacterium haplocladii]|uniref:Serine/threonine protein phosphatase n=1 Tax=Methylobacterium haplocladii TaxID=1176176 RepID=A0A512IS58_9HYPH|nr:metallophosphoesterase [Methylobacterium haplocladii]GEP00545.1 serine/threonine protein phosphatase [Methylobacterium haplocladii]GJD85458.1 Bis(5'-nucleosyl)-tetraphosphatase, symmetrical [Methylobacterium haplocladii]GLS57845.1 serine/threonine protein phosphatase [Methylobacterium haplocladii]